MKGVPTGFRFVHIRTLVSEPPTQRGFGRGDLHHFREFVLASDK